MSNLMRLILSISVAVQITMFMYLMSGHSFILSLDSPGISASGIDLGKLLVSGSNCRLVLLGFGGE